MSELIAPSSELHKRTVNFSIVERVVGSKCHGNFALKDRLRRYLDPFAFASLEGTLSVLVTSTASPTNALTAWIATQPSSETVFPTEAHQIASYNNHVFARDGVFHSGDSQSLVLTEGVSSQLKPVQYGASDPVVVYSTEVSGGTAKTEVLITIRGTLRVDGVGYIRTWTPSSSA